MAMLRTDTGVAVGQTSLFTLSENYKQIQSALLRLISFPFKNAATKYSSITDCRKWNIGTLKHLFEVSLWS
jgi:hypothetical protein